MAVQLAVLLFIGTSRSEEPPAPPARTAVGFLRAPEEDPEEVTPVPEFAQVQWAPAIEEQPSSDVLLESSLSTAEIQSDGLMYLLERSTADLTGTLRFEFASAPDGSVPATLAVVGEPTTTAAEAPRRELVPAPSTSPPSLDIGVEGDESALVDSGVEGTKVARFVDPSDLAAFDVVAVGQHGRWTCSGVLVGPDLVLTARHCLPADGVLFGRDVRRPVMVMRPTGAVAHPDRRVDAAVLWLPARVRATDVRWWDATPPTGTGLAFGFGRDPSNGTVGALRTVPLGLDGAGCEGTASWALGCDPDVELVVRSPDGQDTCVGDSGGPLFAADAEGKAALLAITSRPIREAGGTCGLGGIYTRAEALRPWIDHLLSSHRIAQ